MIKDWMVINFRRVMKLEFDGDGMDDNSLIVVTLNLNGANIIRFLPPTLHEEAWHEIEKVTALFL